MKDRKSRCICHRLMIAALVLFAVASCGGGDDFRGTDLTNVQEHRDPAVPSREGETTERLTKTSALQDGIIRPLVVSPLGLRPSAVPPNSIRLQSDPDDWVGDGRNYEYSRTNALLSVVATGGMLEVTVKGDQIWTGIFVLPRSITKLQAGSYTNLSGNAKTAPVDGGLDWYGNARGCNTSVSSLTIRSVVYEGDALQSIDLIFEQHCEGKPAALRGEIFWSIFDKSVPPGPVSPPPSQLWTPAQGSTPSSGTYIYLESEAGDYVGQGEKHTYGFEDALIGVAAIGNRIIFRVEGEQYWDGDFVTMNGVNPPQPGFYPGLGRFPVHNPVKGGFDWGGNGRGCNVSLSWVVIDSIAYVGTQLDSIDLRFEQRCDEAQPALHGKIHWTAADQRDPPLPPPPVNPPPLGLWSPPSGATPTSGNFIYLASDPDDYIGGGETYLYTPGTRPGITVAAPNNVLAVNIPDAVSYEWRGYFAPMNSVQRFQPGYYGNLLRFPFHNPTKGGLTWEGQARGCNKLGGWFVVDSVTYVGNELRAIDLRFEQHCEYLAPALRGRIRWGY